MARDNLPDEIQGWTLERAFELFPVLRERYLGA